MTDGPAGETKLANAKSKTDAAVIAAYIRSLAGEGARIASSRQVQHHHPSRPPSPVPVCRRTMPISSSSAPCPTKDKTVSVPAELRIDALRSISIVSYACVIPGATEDFHRNPAPRRGGQGKEYEDRENSELEALETYGGRLFVRLGRGALSSIQLIREEYGQAAIPASRSRATIRPATASISTICKRGSTLSRASRWSCSAT